MHQSTKETIDEKLASMSPEEKEAYRQELAERLKTLRYKNVSTKGHHKKPWAGKFKLGSYKKH